MLNKQKCEDWIMTQVDDIIALKSLRAAVRNDFIQNRFPNLVDLDLEITTQLKTANVNLLMAVEDCSGFLEVNRNRLRQIVKPDQGGAFVPDVLLQSHFER